MEYVYKRGKVWWYEFSFQGQRIRESAHTKSKTLAQTASRKRRRELEKGINRISEPKRMPLFKLAAEEWLATKRNLSRFTSLHYRQIRHQFRRALCGPPRLRCSR